MMMGGEEECQPMLLAQRDMIALEAQYYREEMDKLLSLALLISIIMIGCGLLYVFFLKGIH
jgi:hypothetical protein